MKKFILTLSLLLCATTSLLYPANFQRHVTNTGPVANLGQVIKNIISHDANFSEERSILNKFIQVNNFHQNSSYEDIITELKGNDACFQHGLETLEAFERAIMYHLNKEKYVSSLYTENKYLNIFITGIKKSWFNPSGWIQAWHKENDAMIHQYMKELSILATITKKYSTFATFRMKATVDSYLNWRKKTLVMIASYIVANGLLRRNITKSPLGILQDQGLNGTSAILHQIKDDIFDTATTIHDYMEPITNSIFFGCQPSQAKEQPEIKVTSDTDLKTQEITVKNGSKNIYSRLKESSKKAFSIVKNNSYEMYDDLQKKSEQYHSSILDSDYTAANIHQLEPKTTPQKDFSQNYTYQKIAKFLLASSSMFLATIKAPIFSINIPAGSSIYLAE